MTLTEFLWLVVKVIAQVVWVVARICFTIIVAVFLGGVRGASKASTSSRTPRD